ncbi:MAG: MATE family efflux transporter [Clostridiales bacterium]|nr:MAG: MATE family efflux transporter [Clostridiales bacterium]
MGIQLSDHFTYQKLIKFTMPSMAMMIFTSIYGIVDGFFVSNFVGKTPFAAVNLIMPFLMITATVGFMFGTGGSAIVAKTFGEQKSALANSYFSLFVYVATALGVFFAVLGYIYIRPIAVFLGAEGELLKACVIYGRINMIGLPFYLWQLLFQSFFVTAERPNMGLGVTIASGVTNMVLDAVLVILLPQEYKLAGAAWATVLSQVVGGVVPLIYFFCPNSSILRLGKTRYDGKAILKAAVNGSSEFMSNVAMSVVAMLYNTQLLRFAGEDGVAAYGVMMYVSMIFAGAFIGYSIGTAPVVSYHFGAQNHDELKSILRKSLYMLGIFGAVMFIAAELTAPALAKFFVGYDEGLMKLTIHGARIGALSFLLMGFAMFSSGFFTALNDGVTSAIISFLRTLVFEAAAVIFLPMLLGVDGIWWAIVAAEMMAVVLAVFFLAVKQKKYHY